MLQRNINKGGGNVFDNNSPSVIFLVRANLSFSSLFCLGVWNQECCRFTSTLGTSGSFFNTSSSLDVCFSILFNCFSAYSSLRIDANRIKKYTQSVSTFFENQSLLFLTTNSLCHTIYYYFQINFLP